MNREIKFRIWLPHLKTFGNPLEVVISFDGKVYGFTRPTINDSRLLVEISQLKELRDCVVQQYTGLKDSKGKEIFEGDIIQLEGSPYKYEVVWNRWQWGIDSKGIVAEFIQGFTNAVEDRAIVVGNIFENPELLNKS